MTARRVRSRLQPAAVRRSAKTGDVCGTRRASRLGRKGKMERGRAAQVVRWATGDGRGKPPGATAALTYACTKPARTCPRVHVPAARRASDLACVLRLDARTLPVGGREEGFDDYLGEIPIWGPPPVTRLVGASVQMYSRRAMCAGCGRRA